MILMLLILNALFNWGVSQATLEGEPLHFLRRFAERNGIETACKPFFLCPECMSSVWGGLFWSAFCIFHADYNAILFAPFFILALYGMMRIMTRWADSTMF